MVVEKFRDFNASEADMNVSPGHVHQLKANLSQGQFMAFLRVSANVIGAHIWVDDQKKAHSEWGETPHGELIPGGAHVILVELPGFEPLLANVNLQHGEQKELEVRMVRVGYGVLRIDSSAPSITVHIDDQPKGVWRSGEEPLDVRADSGPHKLSVSSDGRKTFEGMINVPRGQVLPPLHVTMIPKYPREAGLDSGGHRRGAAGWRHLRRGSNRIDCTTSCSRIGRAALWKGTRQSGDARPDLRDRGDDAGFRRGRRVCCSGDATISSATRCPHRRSPWASCSSSRTR